MDLKEKCYRSSVYKNYARTIWKSLFPPLKCSHLQHGICQIFNSSHLGPEKTFPFHSWDYCANKTLLYKEGTLCPLYQCRCEIEREPKSSSYGRGSSSSDTELPTITIILPTDLIASLKVAGGLGLGLGVGARAQGPGGSSCARISAFFRNKKDLPCLYDCRRKSKSSTAWVLQNQEGLFCYTPEKWAENKTTNPRGFRELNENLLNFVLHAD